MVNSDNRAPVERFYDEVINGGRLDVLDELVASDFVEHGTLPPPPGREGFRTFLAGLAAAFPDVRLEVDEWITAGDRVIARVTVSGTQRGDFAGIPATGKHVSWTAIHIWRVQDGRLAERWAEVNLLSVVEQLSAD